nr:hypothetical protein 6 [bacterium]
MKLAQKSIDIAVSAIEIYNKPDFKYRGETFCILIINAWELLLKARILQNNKNKISSIHKYHSNGELLKVFSGSPKTIGIREAIEKLDIDKRIVANLESLISIRDSSVHLLIDDPIFEQGLQNLGTANLKNYLAIIREWFELDLSSYNFFLMPLSFYNPHKIENYSYGKTGSQMMKLLEFLTLQQEKYSGSENDKYSYTLSVNVEYAKSKAPFSIVAKIDNNDPNAIPINTDPAKRFSGMLSYTELVKKCRYRYIDFKANQNWYDTNNELKKHSKYIEVHYGNPKDRKIPKHYYKSKAVFTFLDTKYTKKN